MSATDDIRVLLGEHGVKCEIHDTKKRKDTLWDFRESSHAMFSEYRDGMIVFVMSGSLWTPEQAIAATVGCDERESYDAGFASGVKAALQQLYGLLHEYPTLDEIEAWADSQWEEYE